MNASVAPIEDIGGENPLLAKGTDREGQGFRGFLEGAEQPDPMREEPELLDFPVDHVDAWPAGQKLRRGEMYGDDGR